MTKLQIGDTIRFLNAVGGGKVKGFLNKQVAIVEDEYGFDVPVLISECVVIESAGEKKLENSEIPEELENGSTVIPNTQVTAEDDNEIEETPEGEKITTCLAYLPIDKKNLSTTGYECFFVNDSNYYLFFTYLSRENNAVWKTRYNGLIEPNTKIFLEEFDKSQLNELERVCVQFIAFKANKPFELKNPCSVELRIDPVKFYKLHAFRENDYFNEDAIVYYITRNDLPERPMTISPEELKSIIKEKEQTDKKPQRVQKTEKEKKDTLIEVDLHINQLLDTTAGMTNAEILDYQLQKFNEVMQENLHRKNQRIVFIHGKGEGILKSAILKELKNKYRKCYVQDASFQKYGYGATMVIIK
mgnify:CR=1 FL=1